MLLHLLDRRFFLFISSIIYALGLCHFGQIGDSLLTITFLLIIIRIFFKILSESNNLPHLKRPFLNLITYQAAITIGILFGLYIGNSPNSILWPLDAVYTHVPMSQNIKEALQGLRHWDEIGLEVPGLLTHSFTGLWFFFIGSSIYASALSLFCFKILTILFIYLLSKSLFNSKTAYLSSLIYIFAPTVQFYSLNFYKEATVHFLIICSFYFIYLIFNRQKFWILPLLGISLFLLFQERFYLIFLFIPTLIFFVLFSTKRYRIINIIILVFSLGFLVNNNIYLQQSPEWIINKLNEFRQSHMQFNDFSYKLNYEIPYVLAYIKTLFTPYFTFKKLVTFLDLGNLLTWGSFINQGIIVCSLYSMYYFIKKNWRIHLALILPFLILVAFLAYISPWSGRVRDSFYPIIALYSGAFFSEALYRPILTRLIILKNKITGI